jgi:hypothetical protein
MSFFRLLESAGLGTWDNLMEAMTASQAREVFKFFGATDTDSPASLKASFRRLAMKLHPDQNREDPDAEKKFKELTQAYDVLQNAGGAGHDRSEQSKDEAHPIWADAGWSGGMRNSANIYRQDYSDMNYFKKRMWELSNHSREQWTIMQYDGHFFRHTLTVYGSSEIFHEMAEAMLVWGSSGNPYNTRAIFVSRRGDPMLYLIYLDGEFYNRNPIPMEHDSFNLNPGNDQQFMRRLPDELDKIASQQSLLA